MPKAQADPAVEEYNGIFSVGEQMLLNKCNRQSLVVVLSSSGEFDTCAGFFGMLPFRGVTVTLVTLSDEYPDPFTWRSPSGCYETDMTDPGRMGLEIIRAIFGPLPSRSFVAELKPWVPVSIKPK